MGIVIRQSFKASLVTYVGVVLGVVNQLLVATHYLSQSQIGLTRSLLTFSLTFASVCTFGAPAIVDRFFSHFRDEKKGHNGFLTFLLSYVGVGFAAFTLLFLGFRGVYNHYFAAKSPELLTYYFYLIPFTGFNILQAALESYCRNNQRIAIPAFLREVYLKLVNIAIILIYAAGWISFSTFILLYVGIYGSAVVGLLIYLKILGKLYLRPVNRKILTPGLIRQMTTFGTFAVLGTLGGNLCTQLDTIMLGGLKGQDATGIFAIAVLIASLIEIPRRAITQISTPLIAQAIKDDDWTRTRTMHQKAALNQLIIGAFLFLGLWCNIDDLFSLMSKGEIYRTGKYVVLFISLSKLIDMSSGLSGEIMAYSKYYRVATSFVIILGILTYVTNSLLIPLYGITGASMATAITLLIYSTLRGTFVYFKFRLLPFSRQTLLALGIAVATYVIVSFLPTLGKGYWETVLTIALRSGLIAGIYGGLVLLSRVSSDINSTVQALGRRAGILGKKS